MGGHPERNPSQDAQDIQAIEYALQEGYRFLNGADTYAGDPDTLIGIAAAGYPTALLSSKLKEETLAEPTAIEAKVRSIATKFGRSPDLLYAHWPYPGTHPELYLPEMFRLAARGLLKGIGVSNFNFQQVKEAMDVAATCGDDPLTGKPFRIAAVENVYSFRNRGDGIHPKVGRVQPGFASEEFRNYCNENGIMMTAYTPLYKGHDAVNNEPVLQEIAVEHFVGERQATPAQIALAWLMSYDIVPIPKSSNHARIKENLGACAINLHIDEIEAIDRLTTD